jgi:hypothetical protein
MGLRKRALRQEKGIKTIIQNESSMSLKIVLVVVGEEGNT